MAIANFAPGAANTTLTGTSANDTINIDSSAVGAFTYTINTGAGTDTVVFDGVLGTDFTGAAANTFNGPAASTFGVNGYEFLTFDNGTVSSSASITPEQILANTITATIADLGEDATGIAGGGGFDDFDLSAVLDWDGSTATANPGAWTIQSINGQTSAANANITIIDDGEVQGLVRVNNTNDAIDVTAENAFHTSITEIGGTKAIELDVVLTDGTDSFSETLTVNVTGVASAADNTYNGTAGNDGPIDGLGGDDVLIGNDGNDILFGNTGDDRLWAGATDTGNDTSVGGDGDDKVGGGAGNDILIGDAHLGATVFGAAADDGVDDLFGADGNDVVVGGTFTSAGDASLANLLDAAADLQAGVTISGSAGDRLWAGAGDDQVAGAGGDDRIGLGDGDDLANGGAGDDEIFSGAGTDVVKGGDGDDTIYGGAGTDTLSGEAGADTIFGGDDNDTINGGADDDTLDGEGGDDTVNGDAGDDTIDGGDGDDILNGGADDDTINGGAGDDTIDGGADDDTVNGGAGDDTITGGAGVDTINGGTGDDTLSGGGVDGTVDTFEFVEGDGNDTITDFQDGEDLIDLGALGITSLSDLVTVDDGADFIVFYGESDSITLTGMSGNIDNADFIF